MSHNPVIVDFDDWAQAGDIAETLMVNIANKVKDRADEALDAKRIHEGMTLEEFLAR